MLFHKPNSVKSFTNLRERIDRFFEATTVNRWKDDQLGLGFSFAPNLFEKIEFPEQSVTEFMDFLSDALPIGDLYIFGGILRDIALFGQKGFNSDIDLVVDGEWENCTPYLKQLGAKINKFGGYRLTVSGQSIDIWNARETWAIKKGLVNYDGIESLTETTILNWDAILMNWRTKNFICKNNYLEDLKGRLLDVVLIENPNPKGMAVRVFRHLCLKDAKKITIKAAEYLADCTSKYSYQELIDSERNSYGNSVIESAIYKFFEGFKYHQDLDSHERVSAASDDVNNNRITLSYRQMESGFGVIMNCC